MPKPSQDRAGDHDLVILGGGMGGYVAAIRASQLGLRVALVEEAKLGGACLHVGCIPTKALLESSQLLAKVRGRGEEFGLTGGERIRADMARIADRRDEVVDRLHKGVQGLMRKNGIEVVKGAGRLRDRNTVEVDGRRLSGENVIVATGSTPRPLPGLDFDGERVINSDHATLARDLPASVCIVGAGAVGVEFATFYRQMGSRVTLVEALDRLVPLEDEEVSKEVLSQFQKAGIDCRPGARFEEAKATAKGVTVRLDQGEVKADKLLIAVGRAPRSAGVGLEEAGVQLDPKGNVKVDEWMRTSAGGVYAIGDVVGGYLLAHAASHEGITAVEDIAGRRVEPMNQDLVTRCTYSHPQVASVGLTEAQAKDRHGEVRIGKFPFLANGRALIHGEPGGFVKLVADRQGRVLGAHVVGVEATELIAEPALASLFQGDAWEISRNVHPHPTLSEALGEAALAVDGAAIHI
ncbi:MAG: dihydrolipoyl dehydrogenase [Candidatus Dormibacteraceae bacterium]